MAITSNVAPQSAVSAEPHHDADGVGADPAPTTGHIGRIVAWSVIGGLVGAVVAVVGPFAGSPEHVITGSVLLVFAARLGDAGRALRAMDRSASAVGVRARRDHGFHRHEHPASSRRLATSSVGCGHQSWPRSQCG